MARLAVPVIAVVIGEGGSGGALAMGVANIVLMLENSIYSVISPESCSTIIYRDRARAEQAAAALKLTAPICWNSSSSMASSLSPPAALKKIPTLPPKASANISASVWLNLKTSARLNWWSIGSPNSAGWETSSREKDHHPRHPLRRRRPRLSGLHFLPPPALSLPGLHHF